MRAVLDQGLSPVAAEQLRAAGWDVVHVRERSLDTASDGEILSFAVQDSRIVVTLDRDFHAELALLGSTRPSVIRRRAEGLKASDQAVLIAQLWLQCQADLEAGAAISAGRGFVRIHRLPLR